MEQSGDGGRPGDLAPPRRGGRGGRRRARSRSGRGCGSRSAASSTSPDGPSPQRSSPATRPPTPARPPPRVGWRSAACGWRSRTPGICGGVSTTPAGYALDVDPLLVDHVAFTRWCRAADTERWPDAAWRHADRARRAWRGRPFGELADEPRFQASAAVLEEQHRQLVERWGELVLADRHPRAVHRGARRRRGRRAAPGTPLGDAGAGPLPIRQPGRRPPDRRGRAPRARRVSRRRTGPRAAGPRAAAARAGP